MTKAKNFLREEFINGYTLFDRVFMVAMLLLQIIVFIIQPDSIINIICGVAGVISVVLCAKGKISFYFIGFIQTGTYLFLSWQQSFYGEVIENIFYIVTMIWGIFVWKKHLTKTEDDGLEVVANKFSAKQWILSSIATLILTVALGFGLTQIGSQQAYTDAATNVFAIFAQIMMVKRYREQWVWWTLVNLFCLKLWFVAGNWSMFAMYIAWTINCVYGWINWTKLTKAGETGTDTQ